MQIRTHMGISVDGYVAAADGRPVMMFVPGFVGSESHGQAEFLAGCGAIAMGRTTFEPALDRDSWPWADKPIYVLTSRPLPGNTPPNVTAATTVEGLVDRMRNDGFSGDVQLLGGPQTLRSFHDAGLLDQLGLLIFPILLGGGLPLMPSGGGEVRLRLDSTQTFDDGTIENTYVPQRA